MEVHHHAHAPKNWKSLISEFLMLFFAVFCGFLAEYQLEHVVESTREKQLMTSMLSDLKKNEQLLVEQQASLITRKRHCDSLLYFLRPEKMKDSGAYMYYYGRRVGVYSYQYRLATRSLDQLKNGGMFRLIRKSNVADSLSAYDNLKTQYEQQIVWNIEDVKNVQEVNKRLFDSRVWINSTTYTSYSRFNMRIPDGNPQLVNTNPTAIQEYINNVYYLEKNTEVMLTFVENMLNSTARMSELIVREYGNDVSEGE